MNDYWNYLAHGELGKERKGHKYYARVAVGRNKLGFTQYRYFYDAREYGAYMTRQKNNRYSPKFEGKKNTTYFVTGKGTSMVDGGTANKDIQRAKGLGVYTTHYLSNEKKNSDRSHRHERSQNRERSSESAESEATHQDRCRKRQEVCVGVGYSQH